MDNGSYLNSVVGQQGGTMVQSLSPSTRKYYVPPDNSYGYNLYMSKYISLEEVKIVHF